MIITRKSTSVMAAQITADFICDLRMAFLSTGLLSRSTLFLVKSMLLATVRRRLSDCFAVGVSAVWEVAGSQSTVISCLV